MPSAAYAQSTGTVEAENKRSSSPATRPGRRRRPDARHAQGQGRPDPGNHLAQNPGQTILDTINCVPGVSFQNNDAYGRRAARSPSAASTASRISLTFDGIPLNDSGNYAIFSNQQLDPELIEQVNVNLGSTDVDSPTASAVGGTVNYRTIDPDA